MRNFLLIGLLVALPVPVLAQDRPKTFSLPVGCTAYLTVQGANCSVDHHFTCDNQPSDYKSRVSLDEQGMTYMGSVDNETQWMNSFHPLSGHTEELGPDPVDAASFSELLKTGIDTYDFTTVSPELGVTRFVGQDSLTGRDVTIDDVTLAETQFNITAYAEDGTEMWSSSGKEFVSRNWRIFLSGQSTVVGTETYDTDGTPVEFIFPGEPGFLSANPKHGCGVELSRAPLTLEIPHDNL